MLDSIVKNVGTPYTVYLGRNLFSTFMETYQLVDPATRRAMDNLLKTWKEPVPGSMDHRPVFPPETVKPIETALIKFKTLSVQNQRQVQPQAEYNGTPTPPQHHGQFMAPPQQHLYYSHGTQQVCQSPAAFAMSAYRSESNFLQPTPQQQPLQPMYPQPTPTPQQQYAMPSTPMQRAPVDVQVLKSDISSLLARVQARFAVTPYDKEVQNQLNAVLQLQKLVEAGMVSGDSLQQVRDTVAGMSVRYPPPPRPTPQPQVSTPQWQPPVPTPQWQAPPPFSQAYQPSQAIAPFMQTQPQQPQQVPILAPGALNGLQALLANGQKPSTPQMRSAVPALQNASHSQLHSVQNNVAAAPSANPTDLLAALTRSGVLSSLPGANATPSAPPPMSAPPPSQNSTASLLQSISSLLPPPSQTGTPNMASTHIANGKPRIPFSTAALKQFRPELIRSLYDDQPNQCSNCGRRFLATEEGRAKKNMHLDWHFRTNQRMADPAIGRGQHRNWFVDEMEWIRLTEFDPSTTTADAANAVTEAKKQKGPQDQSVRAPAGVTRNTCSICQEEMRSSYSEELQDWVFGNAVVYNGKIAHGTCVEEIRKSMVLPTAGGGAMAVALGSGYGGTQRQRSATPDSLLGKRKAEGVLAGTGARMKTG